MSKRGASDPSSGQDWISFLPDPLLCQILSDLPTKNAVKTSILSTRWRNLWLSIPLLDLSIDDFPDYTTFASFVSRFLDASKDSSLHKLKLAYKSQDGDYYSITSWIETARLRKIQHLDVDCRMSFMYESMPLRLYSCETLVSLRLQFVGLHDFEFVSLPNLNMMHLDDNLYADDLVLEKLISSCPVLEDLTIVRNVDETVKVLRVRSRTLKSLKLVLDSSKSWYIDDSDDWEVLIDAPRLAYMSLEDDQSVSFVISSLGSAAKVEIAVSFNVNDIWDLDESTERNSSVGKLLNGLSSVRDMAISGTTLKIICQYMNLERVPHFHNMTRLETKFYMTDLELLPEFLESCPNLESLVLKLKGVTCKDETSFSSMPKCLQSSLECVEMTRPNCASGLEMKLVKYFLENCRVLKKFTLRFHCTIKEQEPIIVTDVMRFRKCNSACEVNVVRLER